MQLIQVKRPEMVMGHPDWWHNHGHKMKLEYFDKEKRELLIEGSAASVTISKPVSTGTENSGWIVSWVVSQHLAYDEVVRGKRYFSDEDLASAFCLSDKSGRCGDGIIERYGAEAAEQGNFIRWKEYLNIPCPGTGHDGDPNVSIHITETMSSAVRELLS